MKKKSEFSKINGVDLLNALYHALAAVTFPLVGYLALGRLPNESECFILASVFVGAIAADIFKRSVTNSDGNAYKKEAK